MKQSGFFNKSIVKAVLAGLVLVSGAAYGAAENEWDGEGIPTIQQADQIIRNVREGKGSVIHICSVLECRRPYDNFKTLKQHSRKSGHLIDPVYLKGNRMQVEPAAKKQARVGRNLFIPNEPIVPDLIEKWSKITTQKQADDVIKNFSDDIPGRNRYVCREKDCYREYMGVYALRGHCKRKGHELAAVYCLTKKQRNLIRQQPSESIKPDEKIDAAKIAPTISDLVTSSFDLVDSYGEQELDPLIGYGDGDGDDSLEQKLREIGE